MVKILRSLANIDYAKLDETTIDEMIKSYKSQKSRSICCHHQKMSLPPNEILHDN